MGRGEGETVGFDDVERSAPDAVIEELERQAQIQISAVGVLAEGDYNVIDWSRERYEQMRQTLTHPAGAPLPSDGGNVVAHAVQYIAGWRLRERGGSSEQAEVLIGKLHEMSGGGRKPVARSLWAGYDDRGESERCTRRWQLLEG